MQQFFEGVKLEFGTVTLHGTNDAVKSVSSEYYPISDDFNAVPELGNTQAFNRAIAHTGATSYLWEDEAASQELGYEKPTGELVILPVFVGREATLKLAYKFEIFTIVPMGGGDLYIDANNGTALFFNNKVRHFDNFGHDGRALATIEATPCTETIVEEFETLVAGTAATRYSGGQSIETSTSGSNFTLNDASRKVYTRNANNLAPVGNSLPYITSYSEFVDNDNNWTAAEYDNANKDNAALDAHWGAMMTYDYWSTVHGRNSYDNAGAQLRSYVHVDNNYDNAFWFLNVMSYGDGSSNGNEGNGFFDALTSIDVAAHEIGHAVTEFTANLAYQRESGGLNEGYSDIWGAAVEHFAKGNGNDANPDASIWLIGDEIDRRTGSAALRSMSNPTSLGQPDTYGGTNWINPNCGTPTQSNDYCGVHTNSGVLNHWFYLSVAGGSGTNDVGNAYNVAGIGMSKSAAISYRAINVYLTANSTYADARIAMIQSATDLYGAGGAEEQGVTNAWHAVGVGAAYGAPSSYCNSASTNTNDEYISRVQLGTIDNSSGAQFYSDFTSQSTDLTEGQAYTITVTPTWTGTVYSEGYAVWIDYNDDQDFSDAGELVWSKAASTNTPNSGSFTVPTGTAGTATRMRVSMKYNGVPTACETFTYGEVEDYTVNLGGSTADTQAPSVPTGLAASNVTQTTVDLNWNSSTDNVGVTGYDIYQGATNLGTVTGTSDTITGLTASTSYSFSVRARDAAGNVSGASNSVNVTTSAPAGDTQAPTAPTSLAASNVTETTVDLDWNASTDNVGVTGYDVYQGASNLGTVTGTLAQITGLTASTAYSFSVRARDAAGNVSGASNTVNVTTSAPAGDTQAPSVPASLTASNVTQTTVDLSWNASTDNVGVTGYDVYRGATNLGTVTGTTYQATGLTASTSYSFSVRARDAAGNVSAASSSVNVTTLGTGGPTVLHQGFFESGWDGWVDGGSDSFRYAGSRSWEGTYSIRLRDNTSSSTMTLGSFNVTSYSSIDVEFYFYARSMENGEDFWVQFYDGSTWQTVATYARGTSFDNNTFYTATVNIASSSYTFPTNAQFRFRNDASANNDQVYIDQVTITGNSGGSFAPATNSITALGSVIQGFAGDDEGIDFEGDFLLYPNPTESVLNIKMLDASEAIAYRIVNMIGQTVAIGDLSQPVIDVHNLQSGVYFIEVNDGEEVSTQRFIKK